VRTGCPSSALLAWLVVFAGCESDLESPWQTLLSQHANPPEPPPDTSNQYALRADAAALGKKFYFDGTFSGAATLLDMLLRPMTTPGRAGLGQHIGISCNTCHDVTRAGTDTTPDPPGNVVSFGAGAYDVNGQQTINAAYSQLLYWNGRNDSLWSQIVAVVESPVSVGGNRLRVAWRIADAYRAEYEAVFPDYPLPAVMDSVASQKARLLPDGSCALVAGNCPADHCRMATTAGGQTVCLPRFPLEGRPGYVDPGQPAVCDFGTDDPLQPFGDAYDCMDLGDQRLVTRVLVNFAKAVAAYEYLLVARTSPFDDWVAAGFPAGMLGAAAERGARLFVGKGVCSECHAGPLFSDDDFHNIGVPQLGRYVPTTADCPQGGWCDCVSDDRFAPTNCLPWGARDGLRKLQASGFRRDSHWSDDEECRRHFSVHWDPAYAAAHPEECDGRVAYYGAPLEDALKGAWKTPGLRNVALTPPYMHNGMYGALREVVAHYNTGGVVDGGEQIGRRDQLLVPLNLTDGEIDDIVAFLETLGGAPDPVVTMPPELPPASPF
jgi:cytochrome c peroxidase